MSRAAGDLRSESYSRTRRSSATGWSAQVDETEATSSGLAHGQPELDRPGRKPGASHLRLIEMGTRPRFRPSPRVALGSCIAVATIVCLALVYMHVVLAQRQFALDTTNAKIAQQETTYQGLRLRVAELSSPANIISTAEGKLGMIQPSSVNYLTPSKADQPANVTTSGGASATYSEPVAPTSLTPGADSNWPAVKSLIAGQP